MADTLSDEDAKKLFDSHAEPAGETVSDEEAKKLFERHVGEAGNSGPDLYKESADKFQPKDHAVPEGTLGDLATSWANKAPLGAGPQIQGAMAAVAHAATDPMQKQGSDLDAYRYARDEGKKGAEAAGKTRMGQIGDVVGTVTTPGLGAETAGMTLPERAWQGAKIGGATGLISGAAQSKADLTKLDSGEWGRGLVDALTGGGSGFIAGAGTGAVSRAPAALGEGAENGAKRLALGSLDMTKAERAGLARSGQGDAVAAALLGKGSKPGLMGWSKGGTAEHSANALEASGKRIGTIKDAIDSRKGGATVLPDVLGDDLAAAARQHGRAATPDEAGTPEAAAVMQNLLDRAERARNFGGGKPISLRDSEAIFKSPLNDAARKVKIGTSEPAEAALARSLARDAAAGSNERAAEAGLSVLDPKLAGQYPAAKQSYATAKELARIMERSHPEAFAKRGLEPLAMPGLELDVGGNKDGLSGGIRGLGGKVLKSVGAPLAAKTLHVAGRPLMNAPTGGTVAGQGGGDVSAYLDLLKDKRDGGQ